LEEKRYYLSNIKNRKTMPAAALIFAPTIAGGAIISKKAKAKRAQAAANKWSTQFPLVDDYDSMQAMILRASAQLKTLNSQNVRGRASKTLKAEIAELSKWIGVMKAHLKDVKSGLDLASTNVAQAPNPATIAQIPLPMPATEPVSSDVMPASYVAQAETAIGEAAGNLAAPTKKGTNWLLIGGLVIGAIVLVKVFKK
jgi:hypothetical protein